MNLILFSLLSTAGFYLGDRALITQWLWSRFPGWLHRFTACSACVGFWWGVVIAFTLGRSYHMSYLGLDPTATITPILVGLCSMVMTPITGGLLQTGFDRLGSTLPEDA